MIEKVGINKELLALIIRKRFEKEGVNFVTPNSYPLQLGASKYKKNGEIKPHFHKSTPKYIKTIHEILYIVYGKLRVDLYDGDRKVTKILNSGDTILLMGAHGFKVLKNTKIIEVKQGPYFDKKTDKQLLI